MTAYTVPVLDLALFDDAVPAATMIGETAGDTANDAGRSAIKAGENKDPGVGRRGGRRASGGDPMSRTGHDEGARPLGRSKKTGDMKNVIFGKAEQTARQSPDAGGERGDRGHTADKDLAGRGREPSAGQSTAAAAAGAKETKEERREKFRKLMATEYKDLYAEEFQETFNRRFKGVKAQSEQLKRMQPIIDSLMARYGVADGDMEKLQKAVEGDTAYAGSLPPAAGGSGREASDGILKGTLPTAQSPLVATGKEKTDMSLEQYRAVERLRHENAVMKAAQRQEATGQAAMGQLSRWCAEGEGVKGDYPGFDLAGESKNPRFLALLRAGVPIRHAYEVLHLGDIKQGVATETARQTEKRVVDGIRAKGARPAENGMSSGGGIVVKSDVSRLTKRDREEIAKRALQGEKISF